MQEVIKNVISHLRSEKGYKVRNDSLLAPYFYDYELIGLFKLIGSEMQDYDYRDNIQAVKLVAINDMTLDNLKTYLTFLTRGERFCSGLIAKHIDNGIFLQLLKRTLELVE